MVRSFDGFLIYLLVLPFVNCDNTTTPQDKSNSFPQNLPVTPNSTLVATTATPNVSTTTPNVTTTTVTVKTTLQRNVTTLQVQITTNKSEVQLTTYKSVTPWKKFHIRNQNNTAAQPSGLDATLLVTAGISFGVVVGMFIFCFIATLMNLCFCKFLMHECPTGHFRDAQKTPT